MANITITADGIVQVIKIGEVISGPPGPQGVQGEPGKPLRYEDLTPTQKAELKGPKGDPGNPGAPGKDGKSLRYEDLTEQQKAELKGAKGDPGTPGAPGKDGKPGTMKYSELEGKPDLTRYVSKSGDTMNGNLIVPSVSINGSDFLTGTGFPNGVVAAPVGSIYVDKSLTCGALLWIKQTGTGNTGWMVLSGDTGWLDCNDIFKPIFDDSDPLSTGCKIRRINNTVYFTVKSQIKTISEISANIKNGGFSSGNIIPQPIIIQQLRNIGKSAQMQITNYSFMWLPGHNGAKVGDRITCNSSYTTVADWPTALTF